MSPIARRFPIFAAAAVAAVGLAAVVLAANPARAQLIQRDKKPADAKGADKKGGAADDDDILAPKKGEGAKKSDETPAEPAKPKAFTVGLVAVVPVGDAGKTLADKVTTG